MIGYIILYKMTPSLGVTYSQRNLKVWKKDQGCHFSPTTSCFTNHMFRLQQFLLHFSCRYTRWLLIFRGAGGNAKYDSCPQVPNTLATPLRNRKKKYKKKKKEKRRRRRRRRRKRTRRTSARSKSRKKKREYVTGRVDEVVGLFEVELPDRSRHLDKRWATYPTICSDK